MDQFIRFYEYRSNVKNTVLFLSTVLSFFVMLVSKLQQGFTADPSPLVIWILEDKLMTGRMPEELLLTLVAVKVLGFIYHVYVYICPAAK